MAFSYEQIDSSKLKEAIRFGKGVDIQLSRHRGKLLGRLLDICPPAGTTADKGTKIKNLLLGVPLAFYVAVFHPRLMSVVSFYVLSQPTYEIVDSNNRLFRFLAPNDRRRLAASGRKRTVVLSMFE